MKYFDKSKYKNKKVTKLSKCVVCNLVMRKGTNVILHPLINGREKNYPYHYDCWFK